MGDHNRKQDRRPNVVFRLTNFSRNWADFQLDNVQASISQVACNSLDELVEGLVWVCQGETAISHWYLEPDFLLLQCGPTGYQIKREHQRSNPLPGQPSHDSSYLLQRRVPLESYFPVFLGELERLSDTKTSGCFWKPNLEPLYRVARERGLIRA